MTARLLVGYGPLVRFALRRDRVKFPAWVIGIVAFTAYCSFALKYAVPKESDLVAFSGLLTGPAGLALVGPGYGFDHPTYASVFAGGYGLYVFVLGACAAILLAVRHTRGEEETERSELVAALPVSRHAPLAVALSVLVLFSFTVAVACGAVLAVTFLPGSSWLFAAALGVTSLVFGGVALATAQLTEHSRSAAGMAFALFGAAFVVRAAGDALGATGTGSAHGSKLSWLSPFAWAQQTRVYVDDRWWPLGISIVAAVVLVGVAFVLQSRRDFGAGLLPARSGPGEGSVLLRGPLTHALRLQRAGLIGWGTASIVSGVSFGALTDQINQSLAGVGGSAFVDALGGNPDKLLDGYLAVCLLFNVLLAGGFAIMTVQRLRSEEREGRAELLLSLPLGRVRWGGSSAVVAVFGSAAVLVLGGVATGAAAAFVLGDPGEVARMTLASAAYIPAVAVIAGTAFLGYALRPGLAGVAWVLPAYAFFSSAFGKVLQFPEWADRLSIFAAAGMPPLGGASDSGTTIPATPVGQVVLVAVAIVLFAVGFVRIRTRNLPL